MLIIGDRHIPCALGRSGVTRFKREGDGATPTGRLRLLALMVRRDRLPGPRAPVRLRPIRPGDGWCDDPSSGVYNRPVHLPCRASHELLWRDDRLYDVVGILDWNIRPRTSRRGSAIFLHLARAGLAPTEGCIALRREDLFRLLAALGPRPAFLVAAAPRPRRR